MEIRERRTPPPELGVTINRARLRMGLRGREAARLLGISHAYLIQLETGQRTPSRKVAQILAETLAFTDTERALLFSAAIPDVGKDHPGKRAA